MEKDMDIQMELIDDLFLKKMYNFGIKIILLRSLMISLVGTNKRIKFYLLDIQKKYVKGFFLEGGKPCGYEKRQTEN